MKVTFLEHIRGLVFTQVRESGPEPPSSTRRTNFVGTQAIRRLGSDSETQHHRFHLQINAEAFLHNLANLPRQRKNLFRRRSTAIDQGQRVPR